MKIKPNKTLNNENGLEDRTTFFYYTFRNILLIGLPLVLISGFILSLPHSSASISSSDNFTVSVLSSCTLSSIVNSSHSIETINGTYIEDVGKTTISAFCNDKNGYAIYAVGDSDNVLGNNKLVNLADNNYDISSGSATSGAISNWAMKLSTTNIGTSDSNGNYGYITNTSNNTVLTNQEDDTPTIESTWNDQYGTVPMVYTKVASKPSGTINMASGSSFTTTYSIYTSPTQPAGTYIGQVKYLLAHPFNSSVIGGVFMQDVAEWGDALNEGESTQAIDERDGKIYWVAKLSDGHIWMTQNLDLDIGGANTAVLTSENTDISAAASGSGIYSDGYSENNGIWTWMPASTAITAGKDVNYSTNTVSNWNHNNSTPASAEGGDIYFYTSGNNNSDKRYDSLALCKVDHSEADCLHYHAGNYYNWTAAIASNASSGINTDTTRADNSICPRGWRLPNTATTDNAYNEFGRLFYNSAYNITNNIASSGNVGYKTGGFNTLRTNPLWFVRSGGINNGYLGNSSSIGSYWSSVSSSKDNAYHQEFSGSGIWPAYNYYKFYGFSVRCLAR